jgi:predicted nucleic acid-binding protein
MTELQPDSACFMVIVADTSPVNYLVLIDQIGILPLLYTRALIPPAVFDELTVPIGNIELNENMEFASPPSTLPSSAQRTSHVSHRRVGCFQISATLHLENLALRHQLSVLRRSVKRPQLTSADRLLWA